MKVCWDCVKEDMKNFELSHEDAQHKDQWRLGIKEAAS